MKKETLPPIVPTPSPQKLPRLEELRSPAVYDIYSRLHERPMITVRVGKEPLDSAYLTIPVLIGGSEYAEFLMCLQRDLSLLQDAISMKLNTAPLKGLVGTITTSASSSSVKETSAQVGGIKSNRSLTSTDVFYAPVMPSPAGLTIPLYYTPLMRPWLRLKQYITTTYYRLLKRNR